VEGFVVPFSFSSSLRRNPRRLVAYDRSLIISAPFLFVFCFTGKKTCDTLPDIPKPTTVSVLRRKILCKYDRSVPPINSTTSRVDVLIHTNRGRVLYVSLIKEIFAYKLEIFSIATDRFLKDSKVQP